ncbi:MAG: hypothetical protein JRI39_15015 [Deltaproteobacteria bacterium]|nr:hypothetical protein [Deltaproteobacteria bacterium]
MKRIQTRYIRFILLILFLIGGCVTYKTAGVYTAPGPNGAKVTLRGIQEHWNDYNISYAGVAKDTVAALLFDPKDDGLTIIGEWWTPVHDRKTLDDMVEFIKNYTNFTPTLYAIVENGRVFGFVLSPTYEIRARLINDKTLYLYEIESPLYRNDGRELPVSISD